MVREINDNDGKCFARFSKTCMVLEELHKGCGTYACPFYKPKGCQDWVRQEKKIVVMTPPEEIEYRGKADGNQ